MAVKVSTTVGLDIGTTKVCCVVARVDGDGTHEIMGSGTAPSPGVKESVIKDISLTVSAIRQAVSEAELVAGVKPDVVNVGIGGAHIKSMNKQGKVAVARADREITGRDVERAMTQAKEIVLPADRTVLHILPKGYTVDDQRGIRNARGMVGTRLEAEVHIITGAATVVQNLVRTVQKAGLKVNEVILGALASAEAVVTDDEKELGVVLADIGGGTADIAVYQDGAVKHSAVLPFGGDYVTSDLAIGLRTPRQEAERIKRENAIALGELEDEDDMLEADDVGGRKSRLISRQKVNEIAQARMEEILGYVRNQVMQAVPFELIPAGVVFTGGASKIRGLTELAEKVMGLPARVGYPTGISGLTDVVEDPIYSTAVGLVTGRFPFAEIPVGPQEKSTDLVNAIFRRIKNFIEQII